MKILLNRRPIRNQPYGGGVQFINNFVDIATQAGHQVIHELEDNIDVIFIFNAHDDVNNVRAIDAVAYKMNNPKTKLAIRLNDCDKRKETNTVDVMYSVLSQYVDTSVFVSHWMKEYYLQNVNWNCLSNHVIVNGCNKSIFKPNKKLDNGKINIVCHHWSDNEMKNVGLNEFLDDFIATHQDFTFTYIGRTKSVLKNSRVIQPLFGEALGNELGKYDVYISNSYADPGPNHVCESISCGLPTYANVKGGGGAEFAGRDHQFSDFHELALILLRKDFRQNITTFPTWDKCIHQYLELMKLL